MVSGEVQRDLPKTTMSRKHIMVQLRWFPIYNRVHNKLTYSLGGGGGGGLIICTQSWRKLPSSFLKLNTVLKEKIYSGHRIRAQEDDYLYIRILKLSKLEDEMSYIVQQYEPSGVVSDTALPFIGQRISDDRYA